MQVEDLDFPFSIPVPKLQPNMSSGNSTCFFFFHCLFTHPVIELAFRIQKDCDVTSNSPAKQLVSCITCVTNSSTVLTVSIICFYFVCILSSYKYIH